ncbi:MAG: hypothetical protein WA903_13450, partial [Ornithinimicrobium sp.]
MNGMDLSLVEIEVRSGAPVTRQEFAQSTVGRKALSRFLMGYRGALEESATTSSTSPASASPALSS